MHVCWDLRPLTTMGTSRQKGHLPHLKMLQSFLCIISDSKTPKHCPKFQYLRSIYAVFSKHVSFWGRGLRPRLCHGSTLGPAGRLLPTLEKILRSSMPLRTHDVPVFSERELKFMFAICHRPSVCRLSVVCLSVCNVRAPYSGD